MQTHQGPENASALQVSLIVKQNGILQPDFNWFLQFRLYLCQHPEHYAA